MVNFIPGGTSYPYRCADCRARFSLFSRAKLVGFALGGGVFAAAFVFIATQDIEHAWGALILTLVFWGMLAFEVRTRRRNPVIEE